ncbi:hypothetical protein M9H77_03703 [Catharanthus roseus]|uniref:Uncharacterized protein n=1 Tax=Catharanthus roseus TaxID=4058 RepID=A0ACC0CC21_CATRO|nr:hypothetical protein M9H77_03703 [Catharanthus roseus]
MSYINNLHDSKKRYSTDVRLHGQSPDLQNEAIGTKFRHLVVKYKPNNIRALDYKQQHSNITSQNSLQTPGAPTRSVLGQPQFRASPDSPLGDRPTAEHDAMSTLIPVGPCPQGTTPLFKWIYPQSQKPVHVIGRRPSTGD